MRQLRVLSAHPHLGQPNDLIPGFDGAQDYVDAGFAEWVAERAAVTTTERTLVVETTEAVTGAETAVSRGTPRTRHRTRPAR